MVSLTGATTPGLSQSESYDNQKVISPAGTLELEPYLRLQCFILSRTRNDENVQIIKSWS